MKTVLVSVGSFVTSESGHNDLENVFIALEVRYKDHGGPNGVAVLN
jgi:hypothetical protein